MAALDDLYRRHVGDVYRYTYAVLGNHADAEDVTQTTFVNALRALERGEVPRNGSHWLLAISHNLVRQRWRQAASRPTVVELVHDVPDGHGEQDDVELDELVRALQRIPPSQREAIVMRELEGRSYAEIAELLGITTAALETLLFRARRSLADELENLVTCQNAELSISKGIDGRLSRKERKRLDEHLSECEDCTRLAATAKRQRKAFKGLAILPLPVGLALFKSAPIASAATVPTIGLGATGVGATGLGATGAGSSAAVAAGSTAGAGGAIAGGSILGGAAAKVAAVVVAATVATGVGYQGVKAARDEPAKPATTRVQAVKGASTSAAKPPVRAKATTSAGVTQRPSAATPVVTYSRVLGADKGHAGCRHTLARQELHREGADCDESGRACRPDPLRSGRVSRKDAGEGDARAGAGESDPIPGEGANGNGNGNDATVATEPQGSQVEQGPVPPTAGPPPEAPATPTPTTPVQPGQPTSGPAPQADPGDEGNHGTNVGKGHARHDGKHDGKDG